MTDVGSRRRQRNEPPEEEGGSRRVPNEDPGKNGRAEKARPIPHNAEAEKSISGASMLSTDALEVLVEKLDPGDFYVPRNQVLAGVLIRSFVEGWHADPVTIWDRIRTEGLTDPFPGGLGDLVEIQSATPSTTGAGKYAEIVHDHSTLRRLLGAAHEITQSAYSPNGGVGAAVSRAQSLVEALGTAGRSTGSTLELPDLAEILAGDLEPEEATFLTRSDGRSLIYAGKMHVFQAEPTSGKTWLALWAALEILNVGGSVLYLDYEDTARGILGRLLALGADPAHLRSRFRYAQPIGSLGTAEKLELGRVIETLNPDLVVIDGVAEALARDGYQEDKNADVVAWIEKLPRWISRTGAAVLMLDHVVKNREEQGRWARGAGAKLGAVDGATYQVKVVTSFSRHRDGVLKLVIAKDRPGGVGALGETAAVVTIAPKADGARVVLAVDPDTGQIGSRDSWKPTALMEKVSKALEDSVVPLTAPQLKSLVHSDKPRLVTEAIQRLIAEGFIAEATGRKKTLRIVKPYTGRDDEPPPPVEPPPELFDGTESDPYLEEF